MNMSLQSFLPFTRSGLVFLITQALFFVFCGIVIATMPTHLPYTAGADATTWIEPAKSLLLHKDYVMYGRPEYDYLYRPPIVPVFNAFFLWLGGEYGIKTIVMAQIVLVSVTSFLVAKVADKIQKGAGWVAMILFLANPNTLSTAFLIQSETVFVFFLTFSAYALIRYADTCRWRDIIISSSMLAIATLARPTTQYLIVFFPFACWLLLIFVRRHTALTFKKIFQISIASVLAVLLLVPWAIKLAQTEGRLTLTTAEIRSVYIHDQLVTLESYRKGISINESSKTVAEDKTLAQSPICSSLEYNSSVRASCFKETEKRYIGQLFGYPIQEYAIPIAKSFANFFFSGSSGNWHNLLETNNQSKLVSVASNVSNQQSVTMVKEILGNFGFWSITITLLCLLFSLLLKLMSLVGVYELFKRKQLPVLSVCLALITYFFATTLLLGQSRYRVPVEPYFSVLATFGLLKLLKTIEDLKITSRAKK